MDDEQVVPAFPGALLLRRIRADSNTLNLGPGLNLTRIDNSNWKQLRERFPQCPVYRQGQDWCLEYPAEWSDRIEDLVLLLRLFRAGDVYATANSRFDTSGAVLTMKPYPIFSDFAVSQRYKLRDADLPELSRFFSDLPSLPNWSSTWFGVARSYFLLGSSTEFNLHHAATNRWMIRRVLDFMIALEATLVPEHDFVGRRLKERTAAFLELDDGQADELKRRLADLYGVRSNLAHGSPPGSDEVETLRSTMPLFEADVRLVLCKGLREIPHGGEEAREAYLKGLYDVSDNERAEQMQSEFQRIRDGETKKQLLTRLRHTL